MIVDHSSEIIVKLRDSVLKMYVHLIKSIVNRIHLVFSLGDLTGYLVNFLSKLVEGLILSTSVFSLPIENSFILHHALDLEEDFKTWKELQLHP